jgi:hypothetical protein
VAAESNGYVLEERSPGDPGASALLDDEGQERCAGCEPGAGGSRSTTECAGKALEDNAELSSLEEDEESLSSPEEDEESFFDFALAFDLRSSCPKEMAVKLFFPAKLPDFLAKHRSFLQTLKYAESAYFGWIQFRCRSWRYQAHPCASSSEFHCLPCDCLVTDTVIAKNMVPIQEALFSRRPCTGSYPGAGNSKDHSDLIE